MRIRLYIIQAVCLFALTNRAAPGPDSSLNGSNQFAVSLYQRLAISPGNIVASPLSVRTALAISFAGARGRTAEQLRNACYFPSDSSEIYNSSSDLLRELNGLNTKGSEFSLVNGLFVQKGFPILSDFRAVFRNSFSADIEEIDLTGWPNRFDPLKAAAARDQINQWVANHTKNRITQILPHSLPDLETRLIIVNAVSFIGKWALPFQQKFTTNRPFYVSDHDAIPVPTMGLTGNFRYAEASSFQMIELPYVSNHFSMVIVLPQTNQPLGNLEKQLSPALIEHLKNTCRLEEVRIALPKFTEISEFDLTGPLRSMGMVDAFSGAADFSGISSVDQPLFIKTVLHKVRIKVSEEGTEAAGATAVVMGQGIPKRFVADRPFLFWIRDNHTGTILFLGRIVKPSDS